MADMVDTFKEKTPYLITETHFSRWNSRKKKSHTWSCQNVCDKLIFLLDHIFIQFGTKFRRQVGKLFCYERDCMMALSDDMKAFKTTSRYLDILKKR